jgi:hypothetical protein
MRIVFNITLFINLMVDAANRGGDMLDNGIAQGTHRLAAAMKAKIRRAAKIAWEKAWAANSTTAAPTRRLVPTPNKGLLQVHRGLRKGSRLSDGVDEDWPHWPQQFPGKDRDLRKRAMQL